MNIFPILQDRGLSDLDAENHLLYKTLESDNLNRYSSFLRSMVESAIASDQPWVSEPLVKAINFRAVIGLHPEAGQWRTEPVFAGDFTPPDAGSVPRLMELAIDRINSAWNMDPVRLASFALWLINYIHPFRNGNGRTARAICYFILCMKLGGWLPGDAALMDYIRQGPTRAHYVNALRRADEGDINTLTQLLEVLLRRQIADAHNR